MARDGCNLLRSGAFLPPCVFLAPFLPLPWGSAACLRCRPRPGLKFLRRRWVPSGAAAPRAGAHAGGTTILAESEPPVSPVSLSLPPAPSPGAGHRAGRVLCHCHPRGTPGTDVRCQKGEANSISWSRTGRGTAEMGNRNPSSSSSSFSSRGQLVSPRLRHPLQQGQSLIPVLHLEKDGNSIDVMGPWETGELGGRRGELKDASVPGGWC